MANSKVGSGRRRNGTISARLATVETRVEALHHSVETLTHSVESLTRQLANVGKMNWPLLVAGLGVLATWTGVIGFVGNMAIEPVRVELGHLRQTVRTHQADGHPHTLVGRIEAVGSRTSGRFAEVETQLNSIRRTRELQHVHLRELLELKSRLAVYESRFGPLHKKEQE